MNILVTGCAGFIGFHAVRALLDLGHTVVGVDAINDYYEPALKYARLQELGVGRDAQAWGSRVTSEKYAAFSFTRMRLEDGVALDRVFSGCAFDRAINLAAQAGVRYSIDRPHDYVTSNIVGFMNVLECCRAQKTPHLIYASSSSVYGLNTSRPFTVRDNTDHPVSLYAATKKANELMAHSYSYLYGLPVTGLRFFTVYGPWGRPDMAYFKFAEAIRSGKRIQLYNGGDMLRDFTYIDDVVQAILSATMHTPVPDPSFRPDCPNAATSSAPYRVYNVGNSNCVRLSDLVSAIEKVTSREAIIEYLPMQQGDVYATEADIAETERFLFWRPTVDLPRGIESFISWLDKYDPASVGN